MTGGSSFNEVFLHNVRIGDDDRLGAVDQGWRVAVTTLLHERVSVGSGGQGGGTTGANVERLTELARQFSCQQDPHTRQLLVDIYINGAVARLNAQRAASRLASGGTPGPESSLGKLSLTQNLQRISALLSHVLGPRLVADTGEWGTYAWSKLVLGSPGIRIGGGTDEIQKNILAERVLGLPRDAR
jgi:alkylation response protein AidB-like acyl-CoA dehydrogenase